MRKNNAKAWTVASAVIAVIGIGLFITGIVLDNYDTMWMIMVGLLLMITFAICFGIFLTQARRLSRMFRGEALLAHWVYTSEEQYEQSEKEPKTRARSNKHLMIIISFFFILFTVLFTVFGFDDIEDASGFILMMLAIVVILWVVALLAPQLAARRMKRASKEAFIGLEGAWVLGEYIVWKAPASRLKDIEMQPGKGNMQQLGIVYETWQRYGMQQNAFRIPVPAGKEREAIYIAEQIRAANGLPPLN